VAETVLRIERLSKRYGGLLANSNIDLELRAGEIHAVIGPNGAGKTTFIKQLAGETFPTSGRIWFGDRDVTTMPAHARARLGLARSFQITSVFANFTVRDNVAFAAQAAQGHGFRFWTAARSIGRLNVQAEEALALVGLSSRRDDLAGAMSHGEHRQLEIAMALVTRPTLMLLDEPTAGMGREESLRFVELLRQVRGSRAILLVEHDMEVVFALSDRITVLAGGAVVATGTPAEIRASSLVRDAYLGDTVVDHAR